MTSLVTEFPQKAAESSPKWPELFQDFGGVIFEFTNCLSFCHALNTWYLLLFSGYPFVSRFMFCSFSPVGGWSGRFYFELPRCTFDQRLSAKDDQRAGRETRGAPEKRQWGARGRATYRRPRPEVDQIEETRKHGRWSKPFNERSA